ncbi:magnesium/cobalt transporter CorA [Bacillus sp. PS06]|uniref:magnesium/cobalt transporter CorA n=1 Tax=Bacillus sp. PS06 TaxID=2764176 RepID=UPI0017857F5E|nr:magnesium/cobalt transporter CorA [Bacillus sp. PS06]MBD8067446.1 magnesium/cobalt transporter CorA [Bacillus sp. PS06]
MIQTLGITHEYKVVTNFPITDFQSSHFIWCWIDFNKPTETEISHLDYTFKFHPLAIEDCTQRLQRPKLDYYEDYTFFVTHVLRTNLVKEEMNFFIGDHYIVSFHFDDSLEVNHVWNQIIKRENIKKWDEYAVFYHILDKVVDQYFPFIYSIEDKLDTIENNSEEKMDIVLDELFDTRHSLLNLRHTIDPMRDLLYRMLNSNHLIGIRNRKEYFGDIYDHLLKLSEMISSNREITSDIRDSYLSINAHQTNKVMQFLTIITSIFAPLTFIAGIYGMNFIYMPELNVRYGYFMTLGLMAAVSIGMYIWFKRKGWI